MYIQNISSKSKDAIDKYQNVCYNQAIIEEQTKHFTHFEAREVRKE